MFRKEFHVKSNIGLKSSDKKKFANLLQSKLKIDEEIALKHEDVSLLKIRSHNDDTCEIYTVNKIPWAIIYNEKLFPTVYFLWKYPKCLFTFVTHESVFGKIQNGADLMLPGLIIEEEISVKALGKLEKGAPCAIRLPDNNAPFAVGYTNISSLDMLECGLRGKGVVILHVVGDFLWKMGPKDSLPIIPIAPETVEIIEDKTKAELPDDESTSQNETFEDSGEKTSPGENQEDQNELYEEKEPPLSISELFKIYFLMAAKTLKSTDLPILSSTFKGKILAPVIKEFGENERVVVEKTDFKKFSNFLQHLKEQGVIELEERQKGVQYISAVKFDHEWFSKLPCSSFIHNKAAESDHKKSSKSADFKEMFSITAAVLPLIRLSEPFSKKGDSISAPTIRALTTEYVKSKNLQQTPGNSIRLDDLLAQCLGKKAGDQMSWAQLFENLFSKFQPCYEFRFNDGSSGVRKGKPPSIVLSVAKRAGNKKVVLINNLQPVGVDPVPFAKELQIAMAASAKVGEAPASEGPQVLVQGDDVDAVVKLLCDRYNVNKKSIKIA